MTIVSLTMLARAALAMAVLAPATACAKSADQAPSTRETTATKGVTLSTFVTRHEKRLMAGDTDGDGKVSRAEFLAAARAGKADPAKRFAKLDANNDGMLDTAEIDAMLTRRFKRLDTNGDGMLTADERAARRAPNEGSEADS